MGSKLITARSARKIIESLISSNLIDDEDLVAIYRERKLVIDEEKADKAIGLTTKQKAKDGDPEAITNLGVLFSTKPMDLKKTMNWIITGLLNRKT